MCMRVLKERYMIMRIYAIQNGGAVNSNLRIANRQCKTSSPNLHLDEPKTDTVAFKSKAVKGAGLGALIGVGALGLISVLSGGLAAPIAYGAYAATFGALGGAAGNVLDQVDEEESKYRKKK